MTTGGITSGRKTMPSSTLLPQKFVRASSQPMAMPNGSAHAVATTAMRSDSATAVHSAGVRSSTACLSSVPAHDVGFIRTAKP